MKNFRFFTRPDELHILIFPLKTRGMCGTFVIGKAPTPKWMPPELTKWSYDHRLSCWQTG